MAGALLAAEAPLGLLLGRLVKSGTFSWRSVKEEIGSDRATYAYVEVTTTIAFAAFGRVLGSKADRLVELSVTDSLTGLFNARTFRDRARSGSGARLPIRQATLSILVVDLDGLKDISDNDGHDAGDRALRCVADCLRRGLRLSDVAARIGGDEFALLAPETASKTALAIAERIRARIATVLARPSGAGGTASAGVVTFDPIRDKPLDAAALMEAADRALYHAKRAGRNRVGVGTLAGS